MPLDVIKTRMQSLEARRNYGNSVSCAVRVLKQEGILTFWSGALPRLGRLSLSGAIVFTVYASIFYIKGLFDVLLTEFPGRYEKMMEMFKLLEKQPVASKAV
jgi:solute carrier family 25 citrate transporter 1